VKNKEEFDESIAKITDVKFWDEDKDLMHDISNGFYYVVDKLL
jgi:hypothetical protein